MVVGLTFFCASSSAQAKEKRMNEASTINGDGAQRNSDIHWPEGQHPEDADLYAPRPPSGRRLPGASANTSLWQANPDQLRAVDLAGTMNREACGLAFQITNIGDGYCKGQFPYEDVIDFGGAAQTDLKRISVWRTERLSSVCPCFGRRRRPPAVPLSGRSVYTSLCSRCDDRHRDV